MDFLIIFYFIPMFLCLLLSFTKDDITNEAKIFSRVNAFFPLFNLFCVYLLIRKDKK